MTLSKAISTRIRQILKERQITQYRLEQMTGINHNTMTNLLNNRYRACNIRTVVIIIMALNMEIKDFFDGKLPSVVEEAYKVAIERDIKTVGKQLKEVYETVLKM